MPLPPGFRPAQAASAITPEQAVSAPVAVKPKASGLPAGFRAAAVPEGYKIAETPKVKGERLKGQMVEAAQSVLPESQIGKTLIDIGRGATSTAQGIEQIAREQKVNRIKKRAEGLDFFDREHGGMRKPTKAEQQKAQGELKIATQDYNDWVTEKSDELALYRASTEGRKWSALAGEIIGGAASLPIPGIGGAKAVGQPIWQIASRVGTEMGIGGGTAALDFVPEGLSREDNVLMGMALGGLLKGSTEAVGSFFNKITGKMSTQDAQALLSEIKKSAPEMTESAEVMAGVMDPAFIKKQLDDIPESELDGLTEPMKERLAVFQFMDSEPTRGQVLRDPIQMSDEIKLSTTNEGDLIRQRFDSQERAARRKLTDITGQESKDRFGTKLINTMDQIKEDWLIKNHDLYAEAARKSNPNVRFEPSSFTSKIYDLQHKINASSRVALPALREMNMMLERNLALPEITKEIAETAKREFGDNAQAQAYKLMEYMKQTLGLNAAEGNDIVVRTLNSYDTGDLKAADEMVLNELREAILVDTVEGIGGDIFLSARKNFAEMQGLIEQFPVMERLGFKRSGKVQKKGFSEEELLNRVVLKSNNADFNNFMDLMDAPRYAAQFAPIKESIKESVFATLKNKSLSGTLDAQNMPTFVPNKFEKALDDISSKGMGRLRRFMNDDEIAALGVIKRHGELLREPQGGARRSALQPSNTAIQLLDGAIQILGRTKGGRLLMSGIGRGNEFFNDILQKSEEARMLGGAQLPGEIKQLEKMASKKPGISLPSVTPALTRGATVQKDRAQQEQEAIARMLAR